MDMAGSGSAAIMGASGSGKSTLLNLLCGLDKPDRGSVEWGGLDITSLGVDAVADWRREHLGFVFQFHFLLPDLTALENLLVPIRLQGIDPATEHDRARDYLDRMGLGDRIDHLPGELSGGEQQRVALARAFMNRPDVIVADEPFGNLDQDKSIELADLLFEEARTAKAALLIVTHDPKLASRADMVLDLVAGEIVSRNGVSQ
jgi:predicted ABC-type transport system involved in lysophospholipase L1 biosynthesis ATPase subunit